MKVFTSRIGIIMVVVLSLVIGATIAYASVTTFKIKENKIFFTLVSDPENDGEEIFLPSVIGRTGHVYIYKLQGSSDGSTVNPSVGESIEGGGVLLDNSNKSVVLVGDEANNTWWRIAYVGY